MGWSAKLAVAAVGVASLGVIGTAGAHSDPCHSRHTCPSDHHTYAWTDPATGTAWWCVQPGSPEQSIYDRTVITWGGRTYLCYWGAGAPPPDPGPYAALPQATAPVAPQIASVTDVERRPTVAISFPDGWTPQVAQISVDPGPDAGFAAPSSVVAFEYLAPGQASWSPGNQLPPGINYYVRISAVPPTDQCELGICAPVYSSVVGFRTGVQPAVVPTPVAPGPTVTPETPAPTPTSAPNESRFTIDFGGAAIRGRGVIKPGMTVGAMEARWGFASWDEPDFRATGYNSAGVTIEYRAGRRIAWISAYHARWKGPEGITVGMTPLTVQRRLGTRLRWVKSRHWFAGRGVGRRQAYVVQGRYAIGFAIARGRVEQIILGPASGIRQYMTWYGPI